MSNRNTLENKAFRRRLRAIPAVYVCSGPNCHHPSKPGHFKGERRDLRRMRSFRPGLYAELHGKNKGKGPAKEKTI